MKDQSVQTVKDWYNNNYKTEGFKAQRLFPNEELLRFFGRNLFSIPKEERKKIKILETGCGSCANLWMSAHEGYDTYGLDLSEESLKLGKMRLDYWNTSANLICASMTNIPLENSSMDIVFDIFSSNCLNLEDYQKFLSEVHRILKPNGLFFTYTPTIESDAYKNHAPATLVDKRTLNGIYRNNSPFTNNHYPFRFDDLKELEKMHKDAGFIYKYRETITRTYNDMTENFQHVSIELIRK